MSQAKTTPSNCILVESGLSLAAKRRVLALCPNGQVCLIENSPAFRAVQHCHVFARSRSEDPIMDNIEWFWNMRRRTLNLDTRWNIFFAGSALHHIFDHCGWGLLPPIDIVNQYYNSLRTLGGGNRRANRHSFPEIPNGTFIYRLIPLQPEMETVCITRQATDHPNPTNTVIHYHPFTSLPDLSCHIHPKFVILALGEQLSSLADEVYNSLAEGNPILDKVLTVYNSWIIRLPIAANDSASYKADDSDDDDDDDPDYYDEGSNATRPHRAKVNRLVRKRKRYGNAKGSPTRKKGGANDSVGGLSRRTLVEHEIACGKGGWNNEAMSTWIQQCAV